jgi:hypothetical protein
MPSRQAGWTIKRAVSPLVRATVRCAETQSERQAGRVAQHLIRERQLALARDRVLMISGQISQRRND